jgi:DICT domain-containing protein
MTDDLVKRLRYLGDHASYEPHTYHTAADRIEKLQLELKKENQRYHRLYDRASQLETALRKIDQATISHVDGRDLLDELHPRNTLDIKRRIDGIDTWFEGDWLSNLRDARNAARAALGEKKDV